MQWEFELSAYFINIYWISSINESDWKTPTIIETDDCGPWNLISAGYALWLVLVPAVACSVQLPGSVFLFGRSNFYRFSPEIGLGDCFATIALILKALWKGYRWTEAVIAVFAVRDGIGKGDLWWRVSASQTTSSSESGNSNSPNGSNPNTQQSSGQVDNTPDDHGLEDEHAYSRIRQFSRPLSLERIIGVVLYIVAFVKTVTIFANDASGQMTTACLLALAYCSSFTIFELLIWSIALIPTDYSIEDIPIENLLDVLRFVDPGDNPFTFPKPDSPKLSSDSGNTVELTATTTATTASTASTSSASQGHTNIHWNKTIPIILTAANGAGISLWAFVLKDIWHQSKVVFALAISALAFWIIRLVTKSLIRHQSWFTPTDTSAGRMLHNFLENWETKFKGFAFSPRTFLIMWLWERFTTVNVFSGIWITTICLYFTKIFAQKTLETTVEAQPAKPFWLDWLG